MGFISLLVAFPLVRRFYVRYGAHAKRVDHFSAFAFGFMLSGVMSLIFTVKEVVVHATSA